MIELDVPTLFVAIALVVFTGVAAHIANVFIHKNNQALRWWGYGLMLQALGLIVMLVAPISPAVILTSACVMLAGPLCVLRGMAVFSGIPVPKGAYPAILLTGLAATAVWTFADDSPPLRFAIFCAGASVINVLILRRLWAGRTLVGVASVSLPAISTLVTIALMMFSGLSAAMMEVSGVSASQADTELAAQITRFYMAAMLVIVTMMVFGFMLLTSGQAKAELKQIAMTDQLTGLPNRRAFESDFDRRARRADRNHTRLAMAVLDIDHFKQANDSWGHDFGDRVLERVGAALSSTLRDGDFAGRLGGEEFVLLLPVLDMAQARAIVERARVAAGCRLEPCPGEDVTISLSAGVALAEDGALDSNTLFRAADAALYQAKKDGRNRVCAAPPELMEDTAPDIWPGAEGEAAVPAE